MRRRRFLTTVGGVMGATFMGRISTLQSAPLYPTETVATISPDIEEEFEFNADDYAEIPYHDEEQGFEPDLYEEWELDLMMN